MNAGGSACSASVPPTLTVVVCTYNRAGVLGGALQHLTAQSADPSQFEVLVVDNGSTDGTAEVVEAYARDPHTRVRYVIEPERGLAYARNRGLGEARGEYVAYSDDDCRVPPGWVSAILTVIDDHAPDLAGGPYFARFEGPRPKWFHDEYGSHVPGETPRPLAADEFLSGGNLIVRRTVVQSLGGFATALGMRGDTLGFDEETELQIRLRHDRPGAVVYYDPALWVDHLVRPEKVTLRWGARSQLARGRSSWHLQETTVGAEPRNRLLIAGALCLRLLRLAARPVHGFWRDRRHHPQYRSYLYNRALTEFAGIGRLVAEWKAHRDRARSRSGVPTATRARRTR